MGGIGAAGIGVADGHRGGDRRYWYLLCGSPGKIGRHCLVGYSYLLHLEGGRSALLIRAGYIALDELITAVAHSGDSSCF